MISGWTTKIKPNSVKNATELIEPTENICNSTNHEFSGEFLSIKWILKGVNNRMHSMTYSYD